MAWTVKEAMACALCWSGFIHPERNNPEDTPESYWLRISEHARNVYRSTSKSLLLVAVATGQAPALPHPDNFTDEEMAAFGAAARIKAPYRRTRIINALRSALGPRRLSPPTELVKLRELSNTDPSPNNNVATPAGKGETPS